MQLSHKALIQGGPQMELNKHQYPKFVALPTTNTFTSVRSFKLESTYTYYNQMLQRPKFLKMPLKPVKESY